MLTYRHRDAATNARAVINTPVPLTEAQIERAARMAFAGLGNAQSFVTGGQIQQGRWIVMAFA